MPTHKRGQVLRNAPKSCFGGWGELLNKYVDLGTQRELAPISDRAEGRIDCAHAHRIIIPVHHHSSNRTVPGDDPESLEYHFAVNTILLFICSRVSDPLIYAKHLTDFSELSNRCLGVPDGFLAYLHAFSMRIIDPGHFRTLGPALTSFPALPLQPGNSLCFSNILVPETSRGSDSSLSLP